MQDAGPEFVDLGAPLAARHASSQASPQDSPQAALDPVSQNDRTWGMIVHLSALSGTVLSAGILTFVAPLVIWLVKKEESKFLDDQGREALNFQLTIFVGILACIPLMLILIGIPIAIALGIAGLVYAIIAGIKANEGVWYRYPWSIKFISPERTADE